MKWVLPEVVHPETTVCYQVHVPNERHYIGAFLGAMFLLSKPYAWGDDEAHTAIEVGAVWRRIFDELIAGECVISPNCNTGTTLEDMVGQQIRISPDDACIIQMWCIDHWEDWYNPKACIPGGATQNPPGGEIPPGDCATYDAVLSAAGQWLLPVSVDAGDTIEVIAASGGWTSDGGGTWYCPDGSRYVLGICNPVGKFTDGADPLPTAFHNSLIYQVDSGTWYPSTGVTVIPVGISGAQVQFQINDSDLAGNFGSINFTVKVCKGAAPHITITPVAGSILTATEASVGDVFYTTVSFVEEEGLYDGGFSCDGATLKIVSVTNYTNNGTGHAWLWSGYPDHSADPAVGDTSPSGVTGFIANSQTQYTIGFQVMSIP